MSRRNASAYSLWRSTRFCLYVHDVAYVGDVVYQSGTSRVGQVFTDIV